MDNTLAAAVAAASSSPNKFRAVLFVLHLTSLLEKRLLLLCTYTHIHEYAEFFISI